MAADSTTIDPSSKTAMGTFRCSVLNFISALVSGLTSVRAMASSCSARRCARRGRTDKWRSRRGGASRRRAAAARRAEPAEPGRGATGVGAVSISCVGSQARFRTLRTTA